MGCINSVPAQSDPMEGDEGNPHGIFVPEPEDYHYEDGTLNTDLVIKCIPLLANLQETGTDDTYVNGNGADDENEFVILPSLESVENRKNVKVAVGAFEEDENLYYVAE